MLGFMLTAGDSCGCIRDPRIVDARLRVSDSDKRDAICDTPCAGSGVGGGSFTTCGGIKAYELFVDRVMSTK